MITWLNLFDGYTAYDDVFSSHPAMYSDAVLLGNSVELYDQMIVSAPHDVFLEGGIFLSSVLPLTVVSAMLFLLFMPLLRRPQSWR